MNSVRKYKPLKRNCCLVTDTLIFLTNILISLTLIKPICKSFALPHFKLLSVLGVFSCEHVEIIQVRTLARTQTSRSYFGPKIWWFDKICLFFFVCFLVTKSCPNVL